MKEAEKISLFSIFWVMAKIGAFTIGGGYAMILIIEKELTQRGWIGKDEFPDLIALSQAAPGLLAVNISIFSGYRMRGVAGAVVATIGSCIAPFLMILAVAIFFSSYADNAYIQRIFMGIRPAVAALIGVPMVKMARSGCKKWWQWILVASAMAMVAFLRFSPIYILMVTLVLSAAGAWWADKRRKEGGR